MKLLETNILRAMDALHVACALEWPVELFATADIRQLKAAKMSDFPQNISADKTLQPTAKAADEFSIGHHNEIQTVKENYWCD